MVSLILSFDQSLSQTGFAVLEYRGNNSYAWGGSGVIKSVFKDIARLADYRAKIKELIISYQPQVLTRELHNFALIGNSSQLHELNGMLDLLAWDMGYVSSGKYYTIPISFWKKYCTGKGVLKKDTAYMMVLNKFFVSQNVSGLTEPVQNDNIGDAMAMAITALGIYRYLLGGDHTSFTKVQLDTLKKSDQCRQYTSAPKAAKA